MLAFSGRQDEADSPRIETILGRQVPERYSRMLEEQGVFRELYRSMRPIFIDLDDAEVNPRAAIAIRAGDEILGSIWVAVNTPLSPVREQALTDVANIVALHLLRIRAGADVGRRLRADLVAMALESRTSAPAAMARLGLLNLPTVVLAFGLSDNGTDNGTDAAGLSLASQEAARQHAADAFAVHLAAIHPRSAVALVGGVAYGIMPVLDDPDRGDVRAARTANEFLTRLGDRVRGRIGVGRVARTLDALIGSRADADRALRVLNAAPGGRRVARLVDVHTDVLLLELAELANADRHMPSGPVAKLTEYDSVHHTDLVQSLRAWLNAFGNAVVAANDMHVHVNTFRYRVRRIAEVGEVDLDDAKTRFALMLELNLLDTRRNLGQSD